MNEKDRSLEAEYKVAITTGSAGQKKAVHVPRDSAPPPAAEQGPCRLARILALAYHFDDMIRDGTVRGQAEIARLMRVTRARVTQVMTLLLLAPDIQEEILGGDAGNAAKGFPSERRARGIALASSWSSQRRTWLCSGGRR